jgi:hypothetical protein
LLSWVEEEICLPSLKIFQAECGFNRLDKGPVDFPCEVLRPSRWGYP